MDNNNFMNFFVHNGKRYHTGTIFILDSLEGRTEASFICYNTNNSRYYYTIKGVMWIVTYEDFKRRLVSVTDKTDPKARMPQIKTLKDSQIEGLFEGWLWYIILMAISSIFKGALGLWGLITIIFSIWRDKKIKEEGTYIEW